MALMLVIGLLMAGCGAATDATPANVAPTVTVAGLAVVEGSAAAPVLGIVVNKILTVVDLEAGGAAERAGIKRGDVLTRLDGKLLATPADAMRAARTNIDAASGTAIKVTLMRGTQEIVLQVKPAPPAARGSAKSPALTPTAVPADYGYL